MEVSGFRREVDENCAPLGYYHYALRNSPKKRSANGPSDFVRTHCIIRCCKGRISWGFHDSNIVIL